VYLVDNTDHFSIILKLFVSTWFYQ